MFGKISAWYKSYRQKKEQRKFEIIRIWEEIAQECRQANDDLERLLNFSSYMDRHLKDSWESPAQSLMKRILAAKKYKNLSGLNKLAIKRFRETCLTLDEICRSYNAEFIRREKQAYKSFFGNIEGRALDNQQRECIITDEVNNLVVAGAGSGKTTTIVGKVKYLMDRYAYQPSELLVLSFTNASAAEMASRIHLETGKEIDVMTFHKLGKEIIAQVEDRQPSICDDKMLPHFINQEFNRLCSDPAYLDLLSTYFLSYFKQYQSPFEFSSDGDYLEYLSDNFIITLNGEMVKSFEEMEIANFLYINQVRYQYEKRYQYDVATRSHSQYKPDFYLPEYDIYIEHFGIDRNGNVPSFFKSQYGKSAKEVYNEGIRWKRNLHNYKGTTLIETYSYEMSDGVLLRNLRDKLEDQGVELSPISKDKLWRLLKEKAQVDFRAFTGLISTFINHMKANNFSIESVRNINLRRHTGYLQRRNDYFLRIVEPLLAGYADKLRRDAEIDFNDMINMATDYVANDRIKTLYKYILVDEYQDISAPRYNLIKAIRDKNKAKLFCVGDDWQSIYRFAGSDINFFTRFEGYFGYTARSYIETTYRFPHSIIELSSKFILKNPGQIRKTLKSPRDNQDRAYEIIYGTQATLDKELKTRLNTLPQRSTVLLLGRYNMDLENFLANDLTQKYNHHNKVTTVTYNQRRDLDIKFRTAHGAKGLEADYVFILNNEKGKYGFPSNIEDDPVLNLVLQEEEKFPYAEERRLFYVALTRVKKFVYLLVNKDNKSVFIREIEKEYTADNDPIANKQPEPCPLCKTGHLVRRKGKYGFFYGCSRYPRCKFTRNINTQIQRRKINL